MASSGENNKRLYPRRDLCGPRPRPLNIGVGTDSSNINKPAADHQRRPPVVIHLRSPEIIHTRPQDFRAVVQHLTGKDSSSSSSHAQKCGSTSASVVDDCKCKACEISSTGDSIQNDDAVVSSAPFLDPIVPPSWPASPPSLPATSFLPDSPMITYDEWYDEFGPI